MPSIFYAHPIGDGTKEPGIAANRLLTGGPTGGGGGGDDEWKNERRGPRELLNKVRFSCFPRWRRT